MPPPGRTIGPEDLPRLIAAYGSSLRSAGLREGDRVLIGCSLSLPSALVYLGAIYAGLVAVPVEERAVTPRQRRCWKQPAPKPSGPKQVFGERRASEIHPLSARGLVPRKAQACRRAARVRLGSGGVDGHFRVHRCSSFRHGQPWEPDRQYRSHHPQPAIGRATSGPC